MNQHHFILKNYLKITTPLIDKMVDSANKSGALGSKIVGSGGGGSIVCLSDNESCSRQILEELIKFGAKKAFIANIGKGPRISYE